MVGVFCLWSSSGRCVYVDTRCGVCRGCALGSGIGVGSEFAVSDVCSDGCDWAWGRVVSVGARGVCVWVVHAAQVVCPLLMTCVCCVW